VTRSLRFSLALALTLPAFSSGCGWILSNATRTCTVSEQWESFAEFQNLTYNMIYGVGFGTSPDTYLTFGYDQDGTGRHWIINRSTDRGRTWQRTDNYQLSSGKNSHARSIVRTNQGSLLVIGEGTDAASNTHSLMRISTDEGATWTELNDYTPVAGLNSSAAAVFKAQDGSIYALYQPYFGVADQHWIVRRSTDHGASWTTVDNYQYTGGTATVPSAIAQGSDGTIWVIGHGVDGSSVLHVVVRKSTDGQTFALSGEDYRLVSTKNSIGTGIVVHSSGALITSIEAMDASNVYHWIMRKSTDGGTTWHTTLDYQTDSTKHAVPFTVTTDHHGNLYSAGYAVDSSNNTHALIFRSIDVGDTWSLQEDYLPSGTTGSDFRGVFRDPYGYYLATGQYGTGAATRGVIRALTCL